MGTYINIGNTPFKESRNGEYVDKSGLIAVINNTLFTEQRFSCVTRSRRFGKSMAAKMLCAYYDKSCDSSQLFGDLEIAKHPLFSKHLNKYYVLYLDMTSFISEVGENDEIISFIRKKIKKDLQESFNNVSFSEDDNLLQYLLKITEATNTKFFMIVDEWDAICREFGTNSKAMDSYVAWLRGMFKDINASRIFAGVYLTGILPIKKYKTESALNNFCEYSMLQPRQVAQYFGFTKDEVVALCDKYKMDFDELAKWYDGYQIGNELSIFNPNSVINAIGNRYCQSFWAATGAYDQVATYIDMNIDGLKDDILSMLTGGRCYVDTTGFANDMHEVHTKFDVFTVLIHLGYLAYDYRTETCYIPNMEVGGEMRNAIRSKNWYVAKALSDSFNLLNATLNGDEEAVVKGIESAHDENTSILSYNNENSLSCVLSIAYYAAKDKYIIHRELASGKGFADLVLLPRKNVTLPAIVLELKFNGNTNAAIDQIKRKNYPAKVSEYSGEILLVGINYDKTSKQHSCYIERIRK